MRRTHLSLTKWGKISEAKSLLFELDNAILIEWENVPSYKHPFSLQISLHSLQLSTLPSCEQKRVRLLRVLGRKSSF